MQAPHVCICVIIVTYMNIVHRDAREQSTACLMSCRHYKLQALQYESVLQQYDRNLHHAVAYCHGVVPPKQQYRLHWYIEVFANHYGNSPLALALDDGSKLMK